MFGLPTSVRIYLAAAPADMRKGFDGLARLVEMHQLDLYVVKILGRRVRPPQYALVVNERGRLMAGDLRTYSRRDRWTGRVWGADSSPS
jgi:hypothetical protein